MKIFVVFLQIGELFKGHFNWLGLIQLLVFILMGAIAVGFAGFVGYKAFRSKK
ncbi:MAG: hypothetical protein ACR2HG_08040 [Pyrinomonadaceae bacterium]